MRSRSYREAACIEGLAIVQQQPVERANIAGQTTRDVDQRVSVSISNKHSEQ